MMTARQECLLFRGAHLVPTLAGGTWGEALVEVAQAVAWARRTVWVGPLRMGTWVRHQAWEEVVGRLLNKPSRYWHT